MGGVILRVIDFSGIAGPSILSFSSRNHRGEGAECPGSPALDPPMSGLGTFTRSRSPMQYESARVFKSYLRALVCMLVTLLPFQLSYGSHKIPDYPVRPADEYANKVVKGSLIVAVDPVETAEEQKTYFDSKLSARGILPVFIVIKNTSTTDTYLFDSSSVGLGEEADVSGKGARKTAALLGSGGLVDLTLLKEATDVRETLMKKAARSTTLSPGSSMYGFVYVPVPTDASRTKIHLQVPLTNMQSGEIEIANLFF